MNPPTDTPPVLDMSLDEMSKHAEAAAALLKAMASAKRLQILCTLCEGGELSVGALNQQIDLSQSALSQHLKVLRADGMSYGDYVHQLIYLLVLKMGSGRSNG